LSYADVAALANVMRTTRSILSTKLVATATSLEESKKNNFNSFVYGESSTNGANFAKIGPVDVEMVGLTEITKRYK